jgi:hypothetical protein
MDNPTLEIKADDKKGVITGSGTLSLNIDDKTSVKASYEDAGEGKTKVSIEAGSGWAVFEGDTLNFTGHVDYDPRKGVTTEGAKISFTVPHGIALDIQGQFGPGGASGALNLKIRL